MSNGFSSADMSTAAANGHAEGYQDGYADAVKAVESGKDAAAQEAVALIENARAATDFSSNYATAKLDIGNTEAEHILGLCRVVTRLISHIEAAPVSAAPVDLSRVHEFLLHVRKCLDKNGEYAPMSRSELDGAIAAIDGDAEALARVDAFTGRTPAAPGIDLHNLLSEMVELHEQRGSVLTIHMERLKELLNADNPKGYALLVDIEQLRRNLCVIGVVGQIEGYDVIRRNSMLEIVDRARGKQATSAEVGE